MSTITATVLIGTAHPQDGGIQPTHMVQMTENGRIALHLTRYRKDRHARSFTRPGSATETVLIPTVERTVEDIYLLITTYILRKTGIQTHAAEPAPTSLYDLHTPDEREDLYRQSRAALDGSGMKVVFHLLDDCHLLTQLDAIESYPCDFEITKTVRKRERSGWSQKTETITLN